MNVLNLDALSEVHRSITLKGITYPVEEMTVENFILTSKEAEELDKNKDLTMRDMVEATVRIIERSVPTIPKEELLKLNLQKLTMISKFLRGDAEEEAKKSLESEQAQAAEVGAEGEQKN